MEWNTRRTLKLLTLINKLLCKYTTNEYCDKIQQILYDDGIVTTKHINHHIVQYTNNKMKLIVDDLSSIGLDDTDSIIFGDDITDYIFDTYVKASDTILLKDFYDDISNCKLSHDFIMGIIIGYMLNCVLLVNQNRGYCDKSALTNIDIVNIKPKILRLFNIDRDIVIWAIFDHNKEELQCQELEGPNLKTQNVKDLLCE